MTGRWRIWVPALGLSVMAHGALFATMIPEEMFEEERSAGAPAAVWGMSTSSLTDEMEPVTPTAGEIEPETDLEEVVEAEETTKAVETAEPTEQQKPTEAKEVPSETPVDVPVTTPVETPEPEAAEAVISPLVEASREVVSEVKPEEVEAESEVETLSATEPPPPPKREKKRRVQRATSGGAVGQRSGSSGRRTNSAGRASASSYSGRVAAHLRRYKRYPSRARNTRGTVRLSFVIASNGRVQGVRLAGSSGSSVLDRAALAMIRRASPFPPIPANLGRSSMTFTVPVRFSR